MSSGRLAALVTSAALLLALTAFALVLPWQQGNPEPFLPLALAQSAAYLLGVWSVWDGGSSRRLVLGIAVVALLMRIPLVFLPPYLSSDVYRYVWDGRVQAVGINPYRYVPANPALEKLRDPQIFPEINRARTAVTIYPPVAEGIFLAVTQVSASVIAMKVAMVGFEIVTFMLLVRLLAASGLPIERVAVYAWHPLALWEFAGNGHIDAALIAFLVAALWAARHRRAGLAGVLLAGATLTKFYPAVLAPALYHRWGWKMPAAFAAAIVVAYLPYLGVGWQVLGFLPAYVGEEGFDAAGTGFYLLALLRELPPFAQVSGRAYAVAAAAALVALGAAMLLARDTRHSPFAAAAVLATVFMVVVSPHYPWYFSWLIVFACFVRSLALLWLTNACLLLYLVPVGSQIVRDNHRLLIEAAVYGPFAALALADLWYHRREARRSPERVRQH
jgi:alpha-1,6-mannosyltransferase